MFPELLENGHMIRSKVTCPNSLKQGDRVSTAAGPHQYMELVRFALTFGKTGKEGTWARPRKSHRVGHGWGVGEQGQCCLAGAVGSERSSDSLLPGVFVLAPSENRGRGERGTLSS